MARKPDPDARERILDIASRLFTERGVHAVGLQQIIDECGCGKNMLYREFGSKDELIVAFVDRCRRDWDAILAEANAPNPDDPAAQLVALVTAAAEQATAEGFRGCALRNAHAEFPDPDHPVNQAIVQQYSRRQGDLQELARQAQAHDPNALAARISLIIDGLNANGAILGKHGAADAAVSFAEEAINTATHPS